MSESNRGTSPIRPNQPARQAIATFDNYADAEAAVDNCSDQHFTVDEPAVVERDIELVEQVVGLLNYGWAGLRGAGALTAPCSACSCTRCRATGATSPRSSHYKHDTTKSSPTSRSRTKPFACSPAGPIERNESWRPL